MKQQSTVQVWIRTFICWIERCVGTNDGEGFWRHGISWNQSVHDQCIHRRYIHNCPGQ